MCKNIKFKKIKMIIKMFFNKLKKQDNYILFYLDTDSLFI